MKITTITYLAVKNLGNYESERLEATADLEEGEDPKDAALKLRHWVNVILEAHPKLIEESTGEKQHLGQGGDLTSSQRPSEDQEDMF